MKLWTVAIVQILILSLAILAPYFNIISVDATNDRDSMSTISAIENLSNDEGQSTFPQLAIFDKNVYVAWHNEFYSESPGGQNYGQQNIFFRKGSEYGRNFNEVISLADNAAAGGIRPVRLAVSGTSVYVAWNNGTGISDHGTTSSSEVFLRSNVASGEDPFRKSVLLSSSNSNQMTVAEPPELVASGSFVYTVWSMNNWEKDSRELLFKRSTDNGITFEKTVNLTAEDDSLSNASVVMRTINADENLFDVIWTGYNGTGDKGVFLKRSLDYGENFEKTIPIFVHGSDGNVGIAGDPNVASSDNNLYVVWRDNYYGPSGNFIIYFRAIAAGGELGDVITISDETREASSSQIAVFENNVYIVWEDKTIPEDTEIFFRASTDSGKTFGKKIKLSNNPGDLHYTRIAASDSAVFVVWSDESVGNGDIILRTSTDYATTFEAAINLSNNSGWSAFPQIVAPEFTDKAYVVWQDASPGNLDIFFSTITNSQNNANGSGRLQSMDIRIDNKTYQFFYDITGANSVNNITAIKETLSIVMEITAQTNGNLTLVFPRETYDILTFTEHDEPIVFADGVPVDSLDVAMSCEEISIGIPFEAGTEALDLVYGDILGAHSHSYPAKISLGQMIEEEGQTFAIRFTTDAKKCDISFLKEQKKFHVEIEGREEATNTSEGYFRLTIPHDLLGGNYTVLMDGKPTSLMESQFFTKSYNDIDVESAIQDDFTPIKASHLAFSYPKDAKSIDIIGTTAIPEFGSVASVIVGAISISSAVLLHRRMERKK